MSTCRSFGAGVGPIPWTSIVEYGVRAGLDDVMIEQFTAVIRAMDAEYVQWNSDEAAKKAKAAEDAARTAAEQGPVQRTRK